MKLFLIQLALILLALSCKPKAKAWQTLDFGSFSLKTPPDWSIVKIQGIDSYVGGLTNGKDSLWFDGGRYPVGLIGDDAYWYHIAEDTVNGCPALISIPDTLGKGDLSMVIPEIPNGRIFTIWGGKIQDIETVLQIYKSLFFEGSDTSKNPALTSSKFIYKTNANGKSLFMSNCSACHSLAKIVDGPRLQEMAAARTIDWLYKYLTDRKSTANDPVHQKIKKAFNDLECPEFRHLTKEEIVAIAFYIDSN
jgi:hypothetical protein